MKAELKDRMKILLDPLSHGGDMSCMLIEVELLDQQSAPHTIPDGDDVEVDVAILKILSNQEVGYEDGKTPVNYGNWGDGIDSHISIVSLNGGPWEHTAWGEEVDFVE